MLLPVLWTPSDIELVLSLVFVCVLKQLIIDQQYGIYRMIPQIKESGK